MFKLSKDYQGNGVILEKGEYSEEKLINLYGSKDRFNFCLTCTDLKDFLKKEVEEVEEKAISHAPENKAIFNTPENKAEKLKKFKNK